MIFDMLEAAHIGDQGSLLCKSEPLQRFCHTSLRQSQRRHDIDDRHEAVDESLIEECVVVGRDCRLTQ